MKKRKFHLCLLLTILFSHFYLSSQELSNSVYKELKRNKNSPLTQQLVNGGINNFPYNIYVEYESTEINGKNLVLIFFQEQFNQHKEQINETLNFIKDSKFDFKTTVLFSYGNKQEVDKRGMIYGSHIFQENLNTNEDYTVLIFDFDTEQNKIISYSDGITAPSWLIKNEYNAFFESGLKKSITPYYLSQIYTFPFYHDSILKDFLENEIPAVKINLADNITDEQINSAIKISILNYAETTCRIWDHHFIIFRHFNNFITFSEALTIKIIVFIIFSWLSYIILLIFVNTRQKHHAWQRVKNIWWALPATYIITVLGFIAGKALYKLLITQNSNVQQIFTLISFQIFVSLIAVSVFYLLILLYSHNFEPTSVDFLISICCFINQSIFIMVDISLFPIFMFICVLSILALAIKNNILHIIVFVLIIFPFIPYAHTIITTADLGMLKDYLSTNPYVIPAMSLILYSIYIVYFRILCSFRTKLKKSSTNFITVISSAGILVAVILLVFFLRTNQLEKEHVTIEKKLLHEPAGERIEFSYKDTPIFEDTIRTINIAINGTPLQCDVTLWSTNRSPILYSNNDYENINQNSVFFKIPYNPPSELTFSYGASKEPCTILISAIFATEKKDEYVVAVKTQHIGE